MLLWLTHYIHPSQHGFVPGRGTLTAWQELSTKLDHSHIYEFDLRKFFDSVNLCYLSKILKITGIPIPIVELIIKWNQTLPTRSPRHGITWRHPFDEASDYKYLKIGKPLIGFTDYEYWINAKRKEETHRPELRNYEYFRGVSQGMPISPILSTILLAPLLQKVNEGIVLYADDGLIVSNLPILPPAFPLESGISLNLEKSNHVKRNGTWLKPLKFLGLTYTYNPNSPSDTLVNSGTLRNSTRTPKDFELHHLDAFRKAGYYLNYSGQISETFDHWLKTKIAGYLQSRLYQGSYETSDLLQEFAYNYIPNSWAHLETERRTAASKKGLTYLLNQDKDVPAFTIFNSSSYANQSLSRWLKWRCHSKHTW